MKLLKIIGIYFLTAYIMFVVKNGFLWIYATICDIQISEYDLFLAALYSLFGLIGACTYILYTKK